MIVRVYEGILWSVRDQQAVNVRQAKHGVCLHRERIGHKAAHGRIEITIAHILVQFEAHLDRVQTVSLHSNRVHAQLVQLERSLLAVDVCVDQLVLIDSLVQIGQVFLAQELVRGVSERGLLAVAVDFKVDAVVSVDVCRLEREVELVEVVDRVEVAATQVRNDESVRSRQLNRSAARIHKLVRNEGPREFEIVLVGR